MTPKVNYIIATWSGNRYTKSTDYLKVHLKRLFELKHSLHQITIVRPLGSDNDEYYDVNRIIPEALQSIVKLINRPANDRSYGQFIYAYKYFKDENFTHNIIVEDDYVPNIDNFDTILVDLIEKKGVDYLCGKYAKQTKNDRDRAIQNQGIVRSSAFETMLKCCKPVFPPMGPEDGTEQLIFSEYFTNNGMEIGDYSDEYSVPYWAKTLMYFSEKRGFETIFVPYQCIAEGIAPHFLSTIKYTPLRKEHLQFVSEIKEANTIDGKWFVIQEPQIDLYPHNGSDLLLGCFKLYRDDANRLFIECYIHNQDRLLPIIVDRISWENRGENLYLQVSTLNDIKEYSILESWKWIKVELLNNNRNLYKDYRNW